MLVLQSTAVVRGAPTLHAMRCRGASAAMNEAMLCELADADPRAVVVWGLTPGQTTEIATRLLTDSRTSSASLAYLSGLLETLYDVNTSLVWAGTITLMACQLGPRGANFNPAYTEAKRVQLFRPEMSGCAADTGVSVHRSATAFLAGVSACGEMVAAWIA